MIRAIIFDMDGVIVDSEHIHVKAEDKLLEKYKVRVSEKDRASFIGKRDSEVLSSIIQKHSLSVDLSELLEEKYQLFYQVAEEELKLFGGFRTFLGVAKDQNLKLAVASSSPRHNILFTLEKFSLTHNFPTIIAGDEIQNGKPHPEPYQKTIEQLGVKPEECIVVEDSIAGVKSAKAAGCHIIAVTNSFAAVNLEQAGADLIVNNLDEINANIIALFGVL